MCTETDPSRLVDYSHRVPRGYIPAPCLPACVLRTLDVIYRTAACWYSAASLLVLDTTAKYAALEHEMLAHYTASDLDVHIGAAIDSEVDWLVTLQKVVRNPL